MTNSDGTFKAPTVTQPSRQKNQEPRRDLFDVSMHDPLNMSVHSRMGVWEKKVDQSQKEREDYVKSQEVNLQKLLKVIDFVFPRRLTALCLCQLSTSLVLQLLKSKSPGKTTALRSTAEFKNALSQRANEIQTKKIAASPSASNSTSVSPMKSPGKVRLCKFHAVHQNIATFLQSFW